MKQWVVTAGATSIDDLVFRDVAKPEPGPGEVRVKVHAVSLNARDQLLLKGSFGVTANEFIAVSDGAGEIEALGAGVDGLSIGDKVTGVYYRDWVDGPPAQGQGWGLGSEGQDGMLAEYVVLPAERVTAAPKTLSFEQAACLPCAALTAWTALNGDRPYKNRLARGDKVLVTGTGAVSLFAILFAKAIGAQVVATTSKDDKSQRVRALGASDVLNYRTQPDWGELAAERFGGFDRVVNAAGGSAIDQGIMALASGGEMAVMGLYTQADTPPNLIHLMMKGASIRGTAVGSLMAYQDMVEFINVHGIKPPIAETFGLSEAKEAYAAAGSGEPFGKIVIKVSN